MVAKRVLLMVLSEALPSSGLPQRGTARSTHRVEKTNCLRSGRLSLLSPWVIVKGIACAGWSDCPSGGR